MDSKKAYLLLKRYGRELTKQQYKTIKGQIKAGDTAGAIAGLLRIVGGAADEVHP